MSDSPSSSSSVSSSRFVYLDDAGLVQGPFQYSALLQWWQQDYLPPDLQLTNTKTGESIAARELFGASASSSSAPDWYYVDDEGVEQGPFDSAAMHDWFNQQFFDSSTIVRTATGDRCELGRHPDRVWIFSPPVFWCVDVGSASFGPFNTAQMRLWYSKGYLASRSVLIRSSSAAPSSARPLSCIPRSDYPPFVDLTASVAPFAYLTELNEYWRYLDAADAVRGPYSTAQMRHWLSVGAITPSVKVQRLDPRTGEADDAMKPADQRVCSFLMPTPPLHTA